MVEFQKMDGSWKQVPATVISRGRGVYEIELVISGPVPITAYDDKNCRLNDSL